MPTKQGTLFNPKHIIDFLTNEAKEKDAVDGFNTVIILSFLFANLIFFDVDEKFQMRNFFNRDS